MHATTLSLKRARELRANLTPPELRLWLRLKSRGGDRPVFRCQHPIGPFILDFYCANARLAVEVDGEIHGVGDQPSRDMRKDAWLRRYGIEVLRLPAREVLADADEAAAGVIDLARARMGVRRPARQRLSPSGPSGHLPHALPREGETG